MKQDINNISFQRRFVPCLRIVDEAQCANPAIFLNNTVISNFTASRFPICTLKAGGYLLLDFGCELSGGIRIVSGMMEPAKIRLRFGESIAEACGEPNMDHAIHDIVLPLNMLSTVDFGNTGFRFVRIDVLEGQAALVNVLAVSLTRPLEQIGNFKCSDQRLNAIFDTAVRTVHLCIQDYILDGVKRDRMIWGGDLHPSTRAILPLFGAIDALDATLEQLCFNTEDGAFANHHTSYPLWIIMTIYEWYLHSGDNGILEKYGKYVQDTTKQYLTMIKDDGSIELQGYVFLDWPSQEDSDGTIAGFYGLFAQGLKAAEKLFDAMQLDTYSLRQARKKIALATPKPGANKSAAAMQHLAGIADYSNILEQNLCSGISTYMGGYILQCLPHHSALELIQRYWGGMLDMGATTFWEDFDLDWLKSNPTRLDEMPVSGRTNIHADFGRFCYQ
ncbi:MAG: hypothetical protein IKS20_04630, partial [Victivallales bacterium]|nr:hypothetical protein [Victivallales bacterium]